jgi:hypothetical protein
MWSKSLRIAARTIVASEGPASYEAGDANQGDLGGIVAYRALTEALGTSYRAATGYGPSQFGPGRYDDGTLIRSMRWNATDKAFRHVSPPRPVP